MGNAPSCIYCRSSGPFNTIEHVVPESLGNKSETLTGVVCDKCQNYFAHSVEQPALEKTPIAVWRAHLGIPTKAGKNPKADLRAPKTPGSMGKGAFPKAGMTMVVHDDHVVTDIFPPESMREVRPGLVKFDYPLTPWVVSIMTRLLGKMALGLIELRQPGAALDPKYDMIRRYAREGHASKVWPLFWVMHGTMADLARVEVCGTQPQILKKLYGHRLMDSMFGPVYMFTIGTDYLMIALTHQKLELGIRLFDADKDPHCVHFDRGPW